MARGKNGQKQAIVKKRDGVHLIKEEYRKGGEHVFSHIFKLTRIRFLKSDIVISCIYLDCTYIEQIGTNFFGGFLNSEAPAACLRFCNLCCIYEVG